MLRRKKGESLQLIIFLHEILKTNEVLTMNDSSFSLIASFDRSSDIIACALSRIALVIFCKVFRKRKHDVAPLASCTL